MRGPGRGGGRWPSLGLDQKGTAPRLLRLPTNARRCVVGQRRKDLSARRRPRTQAQGPLSLPAVRSSHFSPFFSFPRLRSTQRASFRPAFFPSPCLSTLDGRGAPIVEPGLVGGTLSTYRGIAGSIEDWGGRRTAPCLLVFARTPRG